jgi:membrane carboxypeptidase/penicillin-binding protein
MNRAAKYRPYRDAKSFATPPGIVSLQICSESGLLASTLCSKTRPEVFVSGTQPQSSCALHVPEITEDPPPAPGVPAVVTPIRDQPIEPRL